MKIHGFGIQIDVAHFDKKSIARVVAAAKELGVTWVRIEIDLNKYSSPKARLALVSLCNQLHENNILIVGLFCPFIPLTYKSILFPKQFFQPISRYENDFYAFVKMIVIALKDSVSYWEIWNEQNTKRFWIDDPSPSEYVSLLKNTSQIIRKLNPKASIIFGGIFGSDITPVYRTFRSFYYPNFMKDCIALGAEKYVDYFSFHPYVRECLISLASPEEIVKCIIARINEMSDEYGRHSLIVSEIGVSPVLNPRLNPQHIAWIYKRLLEYSVLPICFYTLIDQNYSLYGRFNPDRDFGLLDPSLNKKALFHQLKTVLA